MGVSERRRVDCPGRRDCLFGTHPFMADRRTHVQRRRPSCFDSRRDGMGGSLASGRATGGCQDGPQSGPPSSRIPDWDGGPRGQLRSCPEPTAGMVLRRRHPWVETRRRRLGPVGRHLRRGGRRAAIVDHLRPCLVVVLVEERSVDRPQRTTSHVRSCSRGTRCVGRRGRRS